MASLLDAIIQETFEFSKDVFPGKMSPALCVNEPASLADQEGQREILPMRFGLIPFGKNPASQKYPLTNARVEKLSGWPWVSSMKSCRCIVPMTSFREPCYWGDSAGTEVDFESAEPIFAAAIYSWFKNGDEVTWTMSLVMRPALPIVMQHGHQRSPFFLTNEGVEDWIVDGSRDPAISFDVLRQHAHEPELVPKVARQMSPTWKKRQAAAVTKRDSELMAIDSVGPLGI